MCNLICWTTVLTVFGVRFCCHRITSRAPLPQFTFHSSHVTICVYRRRRTCSDIVVTFDWSFWRIRMIARGNGVAEEQQSEENWFSCFCFSFVHSAPEPELILMQNTVTQTNKRKKHQPTICHFVYFSFFSAIPSCPLCDAYMMTDDGKFIFDFRNECIWFSVFYFLFRGFRTKALIFSVAIPSFGIQCRFDYNFPISCANYCHITDITTRTAYTRAHINYHIARPRCYLLYFLWF